MFRMYIIYRDRVIKNIIEYFTSIVKYLITKRGFKGYNGESREHSAHFVASFYVILIVKAYSSNLEMFRIVAQFGALPASRLCQLCILL